MPSVPTAGFVLDVTIAGAVLAAGQVAAAVAARTLRMLLRGRRAARCGRWFWRWPPVRTFRPG